VSPIKGFQDCFRNAGTFAGTAGLRVRSAGFQPAVANLATIGERKPGDFFVPGLEALVPARMPVLRSPILPLIQAVENLTGLGNFEEALSACFPGIGIYLLRVDIAKAKVRAALGGDLCRQSHADPRRLNCVARVTLTLGVSTPVSAL